MVLFWICVRPLESRAALILGSHRSFPFPSKLKMDQGGRKPRTDEDDYNWPSLYKTEFCFSK